MAKSESVNPVHPEQQQGFDPKRSTTSKTDTGTSGGESYQTSPGAAASNDLISKSPALMQMLKKLTDRSVVLTVHWPNGTKAAALPAAIAAVIGIGAIMVYPREMAVILLAGLFFGLRFRVDRKQAISSTQQQKSESVASFAQAPEGVAGATEPEDPVAVVSVANKQPIMDTSKDMESEKLNDKSRKAS